VQGLQEIVALVAEQIGDIEGRTARIVQLVSRQMP
jgi:hypothetical protein